MIQICSIEDCDRSAARRGMCFKHYQRVKRHGDASKTLCRPPGEAGEFLEAVLAAGVWPNTCIEWPGPRNSKGYAVVGQRGKTVRVNRVVCSRIHGEPPSDRHEAAHGCGNRGCINPHHLRWDTHTGNMADTLRHGTHNRGERCGRSKLTNRQVQEIRGAEGSTPAELAIRYGVSRNTIHQILSGRSWGWLT